ncbi:MAG TPA: hypothetical protein VK012_05095, partial [Gemmatimonadales bacterium]|nr:hypothetical protein [Gemmatimonadales bacterium]
MPTPATFWIIGETSLSIQCAQALLDRGHVVRGIASDHELVAGWAREHGIPLVARFADLAQALRLEPYDYLLSIVNARILKADILETPR